MDNRAEVREFLTTRRARVAPEQVGLPSGQPPNIARYTFLDDRAHDFYPDWDLFAELTLAYGGLEMAAEPGLTLTIYAAEPGSRSEDAMRLLASWAASEYENPPMKIIEPRLTDKGSAL
jgi:hypothetical protein